MRLSNISDHSHNLMAALARALRSPPSTPRIIIDATSVNGAEMIARVAQRQSELSASGVKPGDFILVTMGRGIQVWVDYLALWGLGAVAVACDSDPQFITHAIKLTSPSAICGTIAQPHLGSVNLVQIGDSDPVQPGVAADLEIHAMDKSGLALVLFTSGSTGLPKAVPLTHGALADNAEATIDAIDIAVRQHLFAPVPFRFISGISHFLAAVLAGVCYQATEQRLLQAELVQRYQQSGADAFGGSPLQARWLAEAADAVATQLRWIMASGDHFPEATIAALRAAIPGIKVITAYGLTELAGRFCVQHRDAIHGSVGKPIAGFSLRLIDDSGSVSQSGNGRVHAGGAMVFGGYLKDGRQDGSVVSDHGFDTGDIGQLDAQGNLWLTGRSDDVFKSGGIKVSVQPIIAGLMSLEIFDDVAVVAVDDEALGHVPHAFYTLKTSRQFDRGDVLRALRPRLDKGHLPKYFSELDQIPRTASGKVKRAELKTLAARAGNH